MAIKSRFEKSESGLYVPKMMRGRVSDIKVYDNFNPLTGEGKLVDYNKGGDNTITSGASWDLLVWAFMLDSCSNVRYTDTNGYKFPSVYDIANQTTPVTVGNGSPFWFSPAKNLFGNLVGLQGASSGIPAHQTSLSGLKAAWWLTTQNTTVDMGIANSLVIWAGSVSVSTSPTAYNAASQNGGIPAISLNVTVTSQSGALAYSIDSIAWCPMATNPPTQSTMPGYFTISTSNPVLTTTAPTTSSQSASPTTLNNLAISALYVLPYTVTVNPNGALQFTYTFQGN